MERRTIGTNLTVIRERRMWTQVRLAKEAGVSPTTVSGIETGRISRPHFGTLRRLANALGVDPQALLSPERSFSAEFGKQGRSAPLSLEWARVAREKEFEEKVEHAPLNRLRSLSQELEEEQRRLQRLYGEFPAGSEQRRFIKQQIRDLSAHSGSVTTSMMAHKDKQDDQHREPRSPQDEPLDTPEPSA
jgi:transcriptional regulator with XRE-family HTH domain